MALSLTVPAATGNGASSTFSGGGAARLYIYGSSFDSGTVKLEEQAPDDETWIQSKDTLGNDVSTTSNDYFDVWLPKDATIRIALTGSSGSTSVSAELVRLVAAASQHI